MYRWHLFWFAQKRDSERLGHGYCQHSSYRRGQPHKNCYEKTFWNEREIYRLHLFLTDSIAEPVFVVFSSAVTTKRIYLLWWWPVVPSIWCSVCWSQLILIKAPLYNSLKSRCQLSLIIIVTVLPNPNLNLVEKNGMHKRCLKFKMVNVDLATFLICRYIFVSTQVIEMNEGAHVQLISSDI